MACTKLYSQPLLIDIPNFNINQLDHFCQFSSLVGLRINGRKTKSMRLGTRNIEKLYIYQEEVQDIEEFCYLVHNCVELAEATFQGQITNIFRIMVCNMVYIYIWYKNLSMIRNQMCRIISCSV